MRKLIGLLALAIALLLAGAACAEITFEGVTVSEDAVYVDFGETAVSDLDGLADFLAQLPNVRQVDMYANRMTRAECDALAGRFPEIRWGWTLVIQARDHRHLVRTDATAFSTLHNNRSTQHTSEDFEILRYCWNLKALDIGHNSVTDIEWIRDLPDLRVLILACNRIEDISPLADLHMLEYAELFKNRIEDLTPLMGLTHLLDLNICFNRVHDWEPLMGMTWLKRLWCYRSGWYWVHNEIPRDVVRALKAALPDTEVDSSHYSTAGTWRYINSRRMHPHYEVITHIFGADSRHPGTGYEPFADSWPDEAEPETAPAEEILPDAPAEEPAPDAPEAEAEPEATAAPAADSIFLPDE